MKLYKRFLPLLFVCALSFVLFSPLTANAEKYTEFSGEYRMYGDHSYGDESTWADENCEFSDTYSWKGSASEDTLSFPKTAYTINSRTWLNYDIIVAKKDGTKIATAGDKLTFDISGISAKYYIKDLSKTYNWQNVDSFQVIAIYDNGSYGYFSGSFVYNSGSQTHSIKSTFTAERDILKIKVYAKHSITNRTGIDNKTYAVTFYADQQNPPAVTVTVPSEEAQKLDDISKEMEDLNKTQQETQKGLFGFFVDVGKWFADLPGQIWGMIEGGLQSLFVPDEDFITGFKDKFDSLLSSRLGAVYQVCDIVANSWDEVMSADETNTINMPAVTIPLPENNEFTFGGYDVQIVPNGFDTLVNGVKLIVGIVCTYLFVNGLIKRYEEVMEGKS